MLPKSPIINAVLASAYIIAVVMVINYAGNVFANTEDTIMAPIVMISLLTLSVAMMAAFFFLNPIQLYTAGKKKEAVAFFTQTLGTFAVLTLTALLVLFSGIVN